MKFLRPTILRLCCSLLLFTTLTTRSIQGLASSRSENQLQLKDQSYATMMEWGDAQDQDLADIMVRRTGTRRPQRNTPVNRPRHQFKRPQRPRKPRQRWSKQIEYCGRYYNLTDHVCPGSTTENV